MKAYLQQHAIYPPFIKRPNHSSGVLYIAARFSSVLTYKKFLFRWSKFASPKWPLILIALFNEAKEGDMSYPFKPGDLNTLNRRIIRDKKNYFKTEFIHYGQQTKASEAFLMDLKLIGDECCFQALKRRDDKLFFLYTNENSIPDKNLFNRLLLMKHDGEPFLWGTTRLPGVGLEFTEESILKAEKKLASLKSENLFRTAHLGFSVKEYIQAFGKNPNSLSIRNLTAAKKHQLTCSISMDLAFLN